MGKDDMVATKQAKGAYVVGWIFVIVGMTIVVLTSPSVGLLTMIFGGILWCFGALNNIVLNQIGHFETFNRIAETLGEINNNSK